MEERKDFLTEEEENELFIVISEMKKRDKEREGNKNV
jgi:hypothetical protein